MYETECTGMQGQTVDRTRAGSVTPVAHYGLTHLFHMDTNLVLTACVKVDLKHGAAFALHQCRVSRDSQLAFALDIG